MHLKVISAVQAAMYSVLTVVLLYTTVQNSYTHHKQNISFHIYIAFIQIFNYKHPEYKNKSIYPPPKQIQLKFLIYRC